MLPDTLSSMTGGRQSADMRELTESMGFIVFFLVITLTLTMFAGEKVLYYYLLLILAGMVTANFPKFEKIARRFSVA